MQLKPVLGPVHLVFYSVGVIVGAGVYSVIGKAAALAEGSLWWSFAGGALVALLTGLSYAEMTTSFPNAGAEYVYTRRALPRADWMAFGVAIVILVGGAAASTTIALAFGGYLQEFVDVPPVVSALLLLLFCTAFNAWGLSEASWVNILFTSLEVAGLIVVVAAGLTREDFAAPLMRPPQAGVLEAAAILFFVYLGFEEVANLSEETRDAPRSLPRAIFLSLAITTTLYVLVALAVTALATPAELGASAAPLALAVHKAWPGAAIVLSAIALFATANTVLISLIAAARLAFAMARDGDLPSVFTALSASRRSPWAAALLVFALSIAFLPIGDLKVLAEMSSFAALVAFLVVNLTLIILRYREPEHLRPFRVPIAIGRLPLLPLLAIGGIGLLLMHFERAIYLAGAVALVLTALAYVVRRHWGGARGRLARTLRSDISGAPR
ncbi:MAG TPA: amino acid permease [Xanthobacteraceae bacterium]